LHLCSSAADRGDSLRAEEEERGDRGGGLKPFESERPARADSENSSLFYRPPVPPPQGGREKVGVVTIYFN